MDGSGAMLRSLMPLYVFCSHGETAETFTLKAICVSGSVPVSHAKTAGCARNVVSHAFLLSIVTC